MPAAGLAHALGILGADPAAAIVRLLELGLLAIEPNAELGPVDDFAAALERMGPARMQVRVHPSVPRAVRAVRPEGRPPAVAGPVGQVRESDGLEPILRLGALWQRAGAEPIRQTQQGTLYKRDRERVEEDPVLAGPIADALAPAARPRRALAGAGAVASGWSSRTPRASGSWPPRPTSGPTTRSTCRR